MTEQAAPEPLTEEELVQAEALAAVLIPGGGGDPSAVEARIVRGCLESVLRDRPRLAIAFRDTLALSRGRGASSFCAELARERPSVFRQLVVVITAAYLRAPEVAAALRWVGMTGEFDPDDGPRDEPSPPTRPATPRYRSTGWRPPVDRGSRAG